MATTHATHTNRFETGVDATTASVPRSRTAFEQWLQARDADADAVAELGVVFSELLTNAVEATPDAHDGIEASAWIEESNVVVRVANPVTPSAVPAALPDLTDPLRTGGRGLLIVRAYTDGVTIDLSEDHLVVSCERRLRD